MASAAPPSHWPLALPSRSAEAPLRRRIRPGHALVASRVKSAYVASKHGILGFTKTIALEIAEMGITCNAICPGYVITPLVENQILDTANARGLSDCVYQLEAPSHRLYLRDQDLLFCLDVKVERVAGRGRLTGPSIRSSADTLA